MTTNIFPAVERLNEDKILSCLGQAAVDKISRMLILGATESTNSYVLDYCDQSLLSGVVCVAESQTQGRGRRGRAWVSPEGHNVYLSMSWQFQNQLKELTGLSLAIGLAVIRALQTFKVDELSLKWPNDVYCQHRKLGGILVDIVARNEAQCLAVIGVGLNRWVAPDSAVTIDQQWIDLYTTMQESMPARNRLIAELIQHIIVVLQQFEQSGFSGFQEEWNRWDHLKGRKIVLHMGQQEVTGISKGINVQGMLAVEDTSGNVGHYSIGEVSLSG
ncbi:MAG: biotin--[acetyl-CoA-carboxylase] ligase [Gammaproteobacteria bacterium]|nr:biotin--[acetyl-CoA-carboxylase] ligase [Gammaproteobacteria bacterium]